MGVSSIELNGTLLSRQVEICTVICKMRLEYQVCTYYCYLSHFVGTYYNISEGTSGFTFCQEWLLCANLFEETPYFIYPETYPWNASPDHWVGFPYVRVRSRENVTEHYLLPRTFMGQWRLWSDIQKFFTSGLSIS